MTGGGGGGGGGLDERRNPALNILGIPVHTWMIAYAESESVDYVQSRMNKHKFICFIYLYIYLSHVKSIYKKKKKKNP